MLIILKTKLFTIINPNSTILKLFKQLIPYISKQIKGYMKLIKEKQTILNNKIINQKKIITIFDTNNGFTISNSKKGIFKYQTEFLSKFFTKILMLK